MVVPLIALRGDMMGRCRKLGISWAEWESRRPPDAAAIVLVTAESAVGEELATFLNRLRAMRQLDRIVMDECHIVLNRRYDFRKEMQKLGKLAAAETQMVMLTATLPPSEEDELFGRMYVEREQVALFRAATARTNVAYRVIRVGKAAKKKEVDEMVLRMVRQKLGKHKKGKVVVYSNSVAKVKELAAKLHCHAYHHKVVGKGSMLEDFAAGKQRVIVATSALGMGGRHTRHAVHHTHRLAVQRVGLRAGERASGTGRFAQRGGDDCARRTAAGGGRQAGRGVAGVGSSIHPR
jgi:superfamily II DNA helicase RecQ